MKWLALTILFIATAASASAQATPAECPANRVCFTQEQANSIFDKLTQLTAAKDLIIKLQNERLTSDQTIANALKVIEGWKEMDAVNGQIIAKKDQIIQLYEKVMDLQMKIIENLERKLLKGKSAWGKFVDALKTITFFLAGAALGRGI